MTAGLPPPDAALAVNVVSLVAEERTLKGSYVGSCVPSRDIPRFIELYQRGRLAVDKLWTSSGSLDEINEGFTVYEAVGCDDCTNGYKGRLGVYQVMPMSEAIQEIVLKGGNALDIAEAAQRSGVKDLRQSALLKVRNGLTSLAEINRITVD